MLKANSEMPKPWKTRKGKPKMLPDQFETE